MANPKDITVKISADITAFNNSLTTAAKNIDAWSKQTMGGFTQLGTSLATLGTRFAVAIAPIAALVAGLGAIVIKTANAGDELLSTSQKVGVSVEKLSALQFAAKLSNLGVTELATGLKLLSKNITETGAGTGEARDAFTALGISVKDAKGNIKPTADLLLELADKFANMEDGAGKTALAMRLFGRSGAEMIPFLNKGSAGINELTEEAKRLGIVFTQEAAEAGNTFNDNLKRLHERINGIVYEIGNNLIPIINDHLVPVLKFVSDNFNVLSQPLRAVMAFLQLAGNEMGAFAARIAAVWDWAKSGFKGGFNEIKKQFEIIGQAVEEEIDKIIAKYQGTWKEPQTPTAAKQKIPKGKAPEMVDAAARAKIDAQLKIELDGQKLSEQQYLESYKRDEKKMELKYEQGLFSDKEYQQEKARLQEQGLLLSIAYSEYEKKLLQEAFDKKKWLMSEEKERIQASGDVKVKQLKKDQEISKAEQAIAIIGYETAITYIAHTQKMTEARLQASEKILESTNNLKKQQDAMAVERGDISSLESDKREIEYEKKSLELQAENLRVKILMAKTDAEKISLTAEISTLQDKLIGTGEKLAAVNREISGSFGEGWEQSMQKWIVNIETAFQQAVSLAQTTANAMSQAFSDFFFDVMTSKAKSFQEYFKGFANAILREISRIIAAQVTAGIIRLVIGAVAGGTTGSTSSAGTSSSTTSVAHSGGLILHTGGYVPRLHSGGLSHDERPAILQTGEYVVSRRGVAALDKINSGQAGSPNVNITVNVQNNSSQPVNAKKGDTKWDGKQFVVGIILDDLEHGGPISNGLKNAPA